MKKQHNKEIEVNDFTKIIGYIQKAVFIFALLSVMYFFMRLFSFQLIPMLDNMLPYELKGIVNIVIVIFLTLIAYLLWFKFGRDEHFTPIVNFEPPKDTNSAELEADCYGCSSERGIKSLIYYLSAKGYIKIEKLDNEYLLTKLKPYDGNNEVEKELFYGIFRKNVETVNLNELFLSNSFYYLCIKLQNKVNKSRKILFQNDATMVSKVIIILICIVGVFLSFLCTIADYSVRLIFAENSWLYLFTLIAIWAGVYFCCKYDQMKNSIQVGGNISEQTVENVKKHRQVYTLMFMLLWCIMFGGIPFFIALREQTVHLNHPLEIIFELICLIICFICVINMDRLSKKGRELKGKAVGFKRFLEVTEKRRFEELIEQNPNYAKEVYPYAFALGITESYISGLDIIASN